MPMLPMIQPSSAAAAVGLSGSAVPVVARWVAGGSGQCFTGAVLLVLAVVGGGDGGGDDGDAGSYFFGIRYLLQHEYECW